MADAAHPWCDWVTLASSWSPMLTGQIRVFSLFQRPPMVLLSSCRPRRSWQGYLLVKVLGLWKRSRTGWCWWSFLPTVLQPWCVSWHDGLPSVLLVCSLGRELLLGVVPSLVLQRSGPWFNIKMSYQYRKSHCGDKMVVTPSYLHNRISYTGKMAVLTQPSGW